MGRGQASSTSPLLIFPSPLDRNPERSGERFRSSRRSIPPLTLPFLCRFPIFHLFHVQRDHPTVLFFCLFINRLK